MNPSDTPLVTISVSIDQFAQKFDFGPSKNTRSSYLYALRIFGKYVAAHKDTASLLLFDLKVSTLRDFALWLAEEDGDKRPRYAEKTRSLCAVVMNRFIAFWRSQNQVSFTLMQEKEQDQVSRVHSRKVQQSSSLVKDVDEDFGDRMLAAAEKYNAQQIKKSQLAATKQQARYDRINGLRALAIVSVLRSTALRISDALLLTREQIKLAGVQNGYLEVAMVKTGEKAHVVFEKTTLDVISKYLAERDDPSPWIFIQHGRSGKRRRKVNDQFYLKGEDGNHTGYGMRIGPYSARVIIDKIAVLAGYDHIEHKTVDGVMVPLRKGESGLYVTPHAFRHWHAQTLKNMGMPLDDIQSVLGHASPETTKKIYAPRANISNILAFEKRLHGPVENTEDEQAPQ